MLAKEKEPSRIIGQFSSDEDSNMLHYLIDVVPTSGPYRLWNEYKKLTGTGRTVNSLYNRFTYTLGPRLHLVNLGIEAKLKLYQKYGLRVDPAYLEILKAYADLKIVGNENIVAYKLKPGVNPELNVRAIIFSPPPSPVDQKAMTPPPVIEPVVIPPVKIEPAEIPPLEPAAKIQKVDPLALFFSSIKEVIKQSNRELLGEFTMALTPNENQAPTNDFPSSMKAFLLSMKTLATHLQSQDLENRIEMAMKKFDENPVSASELQTTLEFTLALLGC